MLRFYVVEYAPAIISIIVVLFAATKLYTISACGIRSDYMSLFFGSLTVRSKQEIKNTFHETLKKYYKSSNKINTLFYATLGCMVLFYLFMLML